MTDFSELRDRGKVTRLRRGALEALRQYPVGLKRLSFVSNDCHCIFRLATADAQRYVVRVCAPGTSTVEACSEMIWLDWLHRGGSLNVPKPLRTVSGRLVTTIRVPWLDTERQCVIYTWMPGPVLGTRLCPANTRKFGQLAARLHVSAQGFAPPNGFQARTVSSVHDYVGPSETIHRLFAETGFGDLLTSSGRGLFESTRQSLRRALGELYADRRELQLIHGDLHTWNASVSRGVVYLFDFHSFAWGFPIQDVATALAFLQQAKYFQPLDRALAEAFLAGYAGVSPCPERRDGQLAALVAGHFLGHMCNVMQMDPLTRDKKAQCISRTEELLRKLRDAPDVMSLCQ